MSTAISTLAQLQAMSVSGDYVLVNNIDATDTKTWNASGGVYAGFIPIGTSAAPFTGTFDGGGFSISNLYINRPTTDYVGLFGNSSKTGTANDFKNVSLVNFDITGRNYVGLLCGYMTGTTTDSTVSGITSSGNITLKGQKGGGLIGISTGVTTYDCDANVDISASSTSAYDIGGFIGNAINTVCSATCSASGSITASGTVGSGGGIGGFVGNISGATSAFTSCYASVIVISNVINTTFASKIGGFVGWNQSGVISLCKSTGSVVCTDTFIAYVGGFCGQSSEAIANSASVGNADSTSAGTTQIGGFIGANGAAVTNCYSRGNVGQLGVAAGTSYIGGFLGADTKNITTCYSTGSVYLTGTAVGGFIGSKSGTGTNIANCFWNITTSGALTGIGATAGTGTVTLTGSTTSEMQLEATFTGFDFGTTWEMGTSMTPAFLGSNITVWPSRTGDYENFKAGVKDDDSFSLVIPTQNEIRWLGALESLLLGTAGDEWKIGSNKLETPLTPTNFAVKQQSEHGSNQVQPVKINSTLMFIDYVSRKLREMTYVDPKYDSPDMTALAEHITYSGITSIARQKNPDSILWFTLGDGSLISMTYERDQNVLAWSKHPMTDAFVQSVCVLPEATEDAVYISVQRTLAGEQVYYGSEPVVYGTEPVMIGIGTVTYLEKMAPRIFTALEDAHFVDCGIAFETSGAWTDEPVLFGTETVYCGTDPVVYSVFDTTAATSTITGLNHLNGEAVKVLGDGVVLDDEIVSDGKITPHLNGVVTPVIKAHVGKHAIPMLQPMRIVLGDSMGSITHVTELVISLFETGSLKYGKTTSNMIEANLSDPRWTNSCTKAGLFTGEIVVSMPGGFDVLNPILISTDKPMPQTVRAIIPRIERTGR
jgi:hypothetical protein